MSNRKQTISDEAIAAALIENRTRKDAAAALGMPVRTLFDRCQSFELLAMLDQLRADQLRSRLEALDAAQESAVRCLREIIENDEAPEFARIKAAAIILDAGRAARSELAAADARAASRAQNSERAEYDRQTEHNAIEARKRGEFIIDCFPL